MSTKLYFTFTDNDGNEREIAAFALVDQNGSPAVISVDTTGLATEATAAAAAAALGTPGDTAWNGSGGGNVVALLKPIAAAALSTAPSEVIGADDEYETVAASQTDQPLGATGATGDYLAGLLIVPATTSPGAVSIKDGSGSSITVFTGGASSVSNLVPFSIPLGLTSTSGAWKVTTGANVSVIASGQFT